MLETRFSWLSPASSRSGARAVRPIDRRVRIASQATWSSEGVVVVRSTRGGTRRRAPGCSAPFRADVRRAAAESSDFFAAACGDGVDSFVPAAFISRAAAPAQSRRPPASTPAESLSGASPQTLASAASCHRVVFVSQCSAGVTSPAGCPCRGGLPPATPKLGASGLRVLIASRAFAPPVVAPLATCPTPIPINGAWQRERRPTHPRPGAPELPHSVLRYSRTARRSSSVRSSP